jgi:hypothetical protein
MTFDGGALPTGFTLSNNAGMLTLTITSTDSNLASATPHTGRLIASTG